MAREQGQLLILKKTSCVAIVVSFFRFFSRVKGPVVSADGNTHCEYVHTDALCRCLYRFCLDM